MSPLGRLAAVGLVAAALLVLPGAVAGHALLQSSDPAAGATLAVAPAGVTLTFGEAPDPKLSSIKVLDSGGGDHVSGSVQTVAGDPATLRVAVDSLPEGSYTVAWRTVSAVDGHSAAGSFAFGVGTAPAAPGSGAESAPTSPSASLSATLSRWLLYIGLAALLGAAFMGFVVERRPPRGVLRLAGTGWVLLAIGSLGIVLTIWSDAGIDLATMVQSSIGAGALERAVAVAGTGIIVAVLLAWRGPIDRWLFGLTALGGAVSVLIDVITGHAAAGAVSVVDIGIQWLHGVVATTWIGGLVALLLVVRGSPSDDKARAVARFSRWAAIGIALVAGTGLLRAIAEVQTIDGLFNTDFGRLVVVKTGLLGVLALLGASNRFVSVPAAIRSLVALRRVGATEVTVGAVVLGLTAVLVNLAPPSSVGAAAVSAPPTSIVASGSDFGTSVRVVLVVSPGSPGTSTFTAAITDYDTQAPVSATSASLRFDLASQSGVGSSTLDLPATGPGAFAASGANLSIDGIWKVTARVTGPAGSVEVPLALATVVPAQLVDVAASPGAPTIDTVHLAAGLTVQLYLDPGVAGHERPARDLLRHLGCRAAGRLGDRAGDAGQRTGFDRQRARARARTLRDHDPGRRRGARGRRRGAESGRRDPPRPPHHGRAAMKRIRRFPVLVLALALACLIAACGGSGSPVDSAAGGSAAPSAAGPRPSSPATVEIVEPASGSTVTGTSVHVVLKLDGRTDRAGHHDRDPARPGSRPPLRRQQPGVDELRPRAGPPGPPGDVRAQGRVRGRRPRAVQSSGLVARGLLHRQVRTPA